MADVGIQPGHHRVRVLIEEPDSQLSSGFSVRGRVRVTDDLEGLGRPVSGFGRWFHPERSIFELAVLLVTEPKLVLVGRLGG